MGIETSEPLVYIWMCSLWPEKQWPGPAYHRWLAAGHFAVTGATSSGKGNHHPAHSRILRLRATCQHPQRTARSLAAALQSLLRAWGNVPSLSTPCLPGTALSLALYLSVMGIRPASCPGACQPCDSGAGEQLSFLPVSKGCLWQLADPARGAEQAGTRAAGPRTDRRL